MENRFGFKDFVVAVLLVGVIITLWVAMKQYDRQWDDVKRISTQIEQLTSEQTLMRNEINEVRTIVEHGVKVSVAPGAGTTTPSAAPTAAADAAKPGPANDWAGFDPFKSVREARALPDYAQGDWLVDAFANTTTATLVPLIEKDLYARRIQQQILETLMGMDPDTLESTPFLAETWHVEDNSDAYNAYHTDAQKRYGEQADADATVYSAELKDALDHADPKPEPGTAEYERLRADARDAWIDSQIKKDPDRPYALKVIFKLRRGLRFSDGQPITPEDIVFCHRLLNNPEFDAAARRAFYEIVEKCEATGPLEVTFTVSKPHYLAAEFCGAMFALPKHFYERFSIEELNRNPRLLMGSGPFRLQDPENGWNPGDPVVLVRNERYWGPQPAFDRLVYRWVPEDSARMTMYVNGELDMFYAAAPEQFDILKAKPDVVARSHVLNYPLVPSGYLWIGWQQQRDGKPTVFTDKRVRQAMTFLIDRDAMCKEIWHGYAHTISGPFPGSPQEDPALKPRPYDPQKARALLAAAGWADRDNDGILEDARGNPFRFTLTYPSQSSDYDRMVLYIKDSFARAGIVMDLEPLEFSVLVSRLEQQTFDAITLRWGSGAPEADIRQMFHSSQTFKGGDNVTNYRNPELDRLIDKARETLDRDARLKLWRKCHDILYDDQPYTFVSTKNYLLFVDKRIHNIQFTTQGTNETEAARTEWYVPKALQRWPEPMQKQR